MQQVLDRAAQSVRALLTCRRGQVLLATVNEHTMVPFVSQQLNNLDLALALAKRGNLPGAEALVGQNFERLFASGQFKEAAEAAAESPKVSVMQRINLSVTLERMLQRFRTCSVKQICPVRVTTAIQ